MVGRGRGALSIERHQARHALCSRAHPRMPHWLCGRYDESAWWAEENPPRSDRERQSNTILERLADRSKRRAEPSRRKRKSSTLKKNRRSALTSLWEIGNWDRSSK